MFIATFKAYLYLILRTKRYEKYASSGYKQKSNYVFAIASLWNYKECIDDTNRLRYLFMNKCKTNRNIDFEGGFVVHELSAEISVDYRSLCVKKRWTKQDYINKTKQSFTVFNTPAVRHCHGWKLPEFMAMGKAIISTPLINSLPFIINHSESIHIVNSERDLTMAIELLMNNNEYRHKLEVNVRKLWLLECDPVVVVKKILNKTL